MQAIIIGSKKEQKAEYFWNEWSKNQGRLRVLCIRWLNGNHAKIEDALSLAMEKAFNYYMNSDDDIRNLFSWSCRISFNVCIDMLREQKKQLLLVEQVGFHPEQFYFSMNTTEPLEEYIQREDKLDQLYSAFETLPHDLQRIMLHRFIDEMEYQQIADVMNISQANVRKRVQLARHHLRSMVN